MKLLPDDPVQRQLDIETLALLAIVSIFIGSVACTSFYCLRRDVCTEWLLQKL